MIRLVFLAVAVISALLTVGLVLAVAHSWRLGSWRERPTCAPWDHHITDRHGTRRLTRYIGRPHVVDAAPMYSDADYELPDAEQLAEQAAWESFCADNADVAQACRELTEETSVPARDVTTDDRMYFAQSAEPLRISRIAVGTERIAFELVTLPNGTPIIVERGPAEEVLIEAGS